MQSSLTFHWYSSFFIPYLGRAQIAVSHHDAITLLATPGSCYLWRMCSGTEHLQAYKYRWPKLTNYLEADKSCSLAVVWFISLLHMWRILFSPVKCYGVLLGKADVLVLASHGRLEQIQRCSPSVSGVVYQCYHWLIIYHINKDWDITEGASLAWSVLLFCCLFIAILTQSTDLPCFKHFLLYNGNRFHLMIFYFTNYFFMHRCLYSPNVS